MPTRDQQMLFTTLLAPCEKSKSLGSPIGKISYSIEKIKIESVKVGSSEVEIEKDSGLKIELKEVKAKASCDWKYSTWAAKDHGSADLEASVSATAVIAVGDKSDLPSVSVSSEDADVNNLDVKLHGGASWLYNLFVKTFSGAIKDSIKKSLNDALKKQLADQANEFLKSLPTEEKLDPEAKIEFGLVSAPIFSGSHLTTPHQGAVVPLSGDKPPMQPNSIPDSVTGAMIEVILSEYLANSAGWTYWQSNIMNVTITDAQIPAKSAVHLNTTYFCDMIPVLCQKYPDNLMTLNVAANKAPTASFKSSGLAVEGVGALTVGVVTGSGGVDAAFCEWRPCIWIPHSQGRPNRAVELQGDGRRWLCGHQQRCAVQTHCRRTAGRSDRMSAVVVFYQL